jgi:hypothetical protein
MKPVISQFRTEIRHFYIVSLFNLVFAALAIASGILYFIAAVTGMTADLPGPWLRIITGAIAMVCMGLGLSWLLSSLAVFEGIEEIKDDLDREGNDVSDNRITCLIVRMLAHYRDNRKTIFTMIRVCTAGGVCFFILGIATSLEAISITPGGIGVSLNNFRVIPAMLFSIGIASMTLISSRFLSRYADVWDRRLHEIEESECVMKKTLGLEEQ